MTKKEKNPKLKKKKKTKITDNTHNLDLNQPGVDLIINASLALNASRARRNRVFFINGRHDDVNLSQKLLRLLFIVTITAILILSLIKAICFSQALIYSNYECILSTELKIRKDSVGIELDRSRKHLSPCLFCFRYIFII